MTIIYYLIINIIAIFIYGIDKKKAIRHQYRIPEKTLLLIGFLGGGAGSLIGMYAFHHKTSKWKFRILVPLCTALHILLIIFVIYPNPWLWRF